MDEKYSDKFLYSIFSNSEITLDKSAHLVHDEGVKEV